jgi:hypothetical protein
MRKIRRIVVARLEVRKDENCVTLELLYEPGRLQRYCTVANWSGVKWLS